MSVSHVFSALKVFAVAGLLAYCHSVCGQTDTVPSQESQDVSAVSDAVSNSSVSRGIIIGRVSSAKILPLMPQYKSVRNNLLALKEQYEAEAKKSESDFQRKFEEFMKGQKEFPKTILEKRQNELQNMLEANATFRVKVQALLEEAEKAMMTDVRAELSDAISTVAQRKGVSLVVDIDGGSVPYIVPGLAMDLTKDVMQVLGIETVSAGL